jgi:general secretion pathway protein J
MKTPSVSTQHGFTLLEILLVIILLAFLMTGAYSGITAATRAIRSGEAAIERIDKVRTVQEFLRHQLSRTLPFPFVQTNTTKVIFQGENNFMRFVAPMPGYLSKGGAYVQTLELTQGQDGQQLVFTSTLLNGFSFDRSSSDASSTVVLLEHIHDGKFSYRGLNKNGDLTRWSDGWNDSSSTPLLVGIDLDLGESGQINWPSMAIPLMMDATATRLGSNTGFGR